jgi:phage anti-repressor protein
MTSLNIVDLIEQNPIIKLSNTYQSKLLTKIKNKFYNTEQQLFVASFYSYLNYNTTLDFVINLDDIWKWIGFNQKIKAKILLEKHFIIDKDYKKQNFDDKTHGGHNKEIFMLTINAFKLFCLKAGTKKADQIHEYYIKLEETLHEVINEESNELKIQLDQLKNEIVYIESNIKKEKELEKQNVLLREFGNAGALIYVLRVKSYENGQYIIKIGESRRGVEARYNEHKSKYEEAVLLDCFMVKRSRDFELFLHNHKDIKLSNITDLQGHEQERELFLIGKRLSYAILLNIIKMNLNQFNDYDIEKIKTENEVLTNLITHQTNHSNDSILNTTAVKQILDTLTSLVQDNKQLLAKVSELEQSNKEILEKLHSTQTRTTTGFEQPNQTLGPRLQKIHPETLQLIKVYETVSECMKENSKMKRPSLHKAIQENTVYNGFRWMYVDRELDPNHISETLEQTKRTKIQQLGYIAKLNADKSKILNVYLDRKTAASLNNYQSNSALDTPVKKGSITNGHYYILYDECSSPLKQDFKSRNRDNEPILYKDGVGQYDQHHQLVREFTCKYDCIKKLSMSDKTLAKALDKPVAYQGSYFKRLGTRVAL